MVFDKVVDGGCSNRRPDVRTECLTHTVIVECDENQHKSGDYSCESKRTMELFQDLGNRPIVVIRFNPDSYLEDDQKIPGCFKTTKTGIFSPNKKEWDWRMKELKRAVYRRVQTVPEKEVTEVKLFFDS